MKLFLKIFILLLLAGFIVLQFYQPEKNQGEQLTEKGLIWSTDIPPELGEKFMASCYDCHSNYTHYPFYGYISPVSWLLDNHISEGKEKLNFSEWAVYSEKDKISLLIGICDEVSGKTMPLTVYVKLHKDALLSLDDIFQICDWTDQELDKIINRK
jgi:hypothetical protein